MMTRIVLSSALFLLLLVAPAARAESFPTVPYALSEGSTYQEGCFEPCLCPILMEQPMTGSFDLVFYPFAGPIWTVGVEHVAWKVPSLGKEITGQGIYRRAGDQQNLQLDLQIDDEPPQVFDSGWVAGGDLYPLIDVTLSKNGFFCYDIALHVVAEPVDAVPHVSLDRAQLIWTAVAGAEGYDVVSGDLTELRANGGEFGAALDACMADGLPTTSLPLDAAPGQALWFLVRPEDGSYDEGSPSQVGSRDEEIASSSLACP